jgi:hypothetical protein
MACEPEPTPFPVAIPPPSTDVPLTISASSSIRYTFAPNTAGLVADLELISESAQVEQLTEEVNPDELGTRYDIVTAYGDLPGGTRSPVMAHVALLVNPDITPLDNSAVISIVQHSIDAQAVIEHLAISGAQVDLSQAAIATSTLRLQLANAGWPDGFHLTTAYAYTPGAVEMVEQLQAIGISSQMLLMTDADIAAELDDGQIHLALVTWTAPEQRERWETLVGSANVLDLYTIPISYLAMPELTITFTANGWPLVTR